MSLFGALDTSVSGLTSQAQAFADISNNVANSQTVGYKRVDTSFGDYLTEATPSDFDSVTTVARPVYENNVQGSVIQTSNPTAFAITGNGFFAVSQATSDFDGSTVFSPQTYYTRAGDFATNKEGYLVNSSGAYLQGWPVNSTTGVADQTILEPIQISQTSYKPQPSANITLSANLPANSSILTLASTVDVYDAQGTTHTLKLDFSLNSSVGSNVWDVTVYDDAATPNQIGSAELTFSADGTLSNVTDNMLATNDTTALATADNTTTPPAQMQLQTQYATVPAGDLQDITLNLGTIASASGLTQFASSDDAYTLRSVTQDGVPPGAFAGLTTTTGGKIVANYDNGQTKILYQVPVVTFPASNALQTENNNMYTATLASGNALANTAGTQGSGTLATSSQESSNVDIGTEFSNLIIAQQAYTANAKMVTTADDLLTTTVNMKR